MTALASPGAEWFESWLECVRDFGEEFCHGSGQWTIQDFGPDRRSFDALLEEIRVQSDPARTLPPGRVHSDYYWVAEGATMIGFLALRHSINTPFLNTLGGHIGFSIRPAYRGQGHASRALGLVLPRARELGLDRLLLTCDEDNIGSARTIQSQGGILETVLDGMQRYWIML
ncbi:MAG: GNAT family N-acetyltransferase [Dermatophilaceae bacterium]